MEDSGGLEESREKLQPVGAGLLEDQDYYCIIIV